MVQLLRQNGEQRIESSKLPGLEDLKTDLLRRCILMAEADFPGAIKLFRQTLYSEMMRCASWVNLTTYCPTMKPLPGGGATYDDNHSKAQL